MPILPLGPWLFRTVRGPLRQLRPLIVGGVLGLTGHGFAQDPELLPSHWFENVLATDGSTQSCLVFRTVPGVSYTVEATNNLTTWTEQVSLYGLGHEFVTPMRSFAPPPAPPPDGNPPPETAGRCSLSRSECNPPTTRRAAPWCRGPRWKAAGR